MIKKPLVLTDGEIEQLQPSDLLSSIPNSLQLTNGNTGDLPVCAPVYISSSDTVQHATADDFPNVIGLTIEVIIPSSSGVIQVDGKFTAATTEWDAVTGQIGGLTPGSVYYLGAIGGLTVIPVTTGYLTRLGIAINTTDFEIKISRPIRL